MHVPASVLVLAGHRVFVTKQTEQSYWQIFINVTLLLWHLSSLLMKAAWECHGSITQTKRGYGSVIYLIIEIIISLVVVTYIRYSHIHTLYSIFSLKPFCIYLLTSIVNCNPSSLPCTLCSFLASLYCWRNMLASTTIPWTHRSDDHGRLRVFMDW